MVILLARANRSGSGKNWSVYSLGHALVLDRQTFADGDDILRRIQRCDADDVVIVASHSLIAKLLDGGSARSTGESAYHATWTMDGVYRTSAARIDQSAV